MDRIALGADIGGSHITTQLVDLNQNLLLSKTKVRLEINCHASKEIILDAWIEAIKKSCAGFSPEKLAGIGFAMPGPFDYLKGIAWFKGVQKFEKLYSVHIRDELLKRLQLSKEFPVRFLNDAACFAIGEAWLGEVSVHKKIIALTLGTGFGTAFINDLLPVAGINGIPDDGFLYHIPFKSSVADDYFSTRWFLNEYKRLTGQQISGVKVLSELAFNNELVMNLFGQFGKNLGEFLAPWVKRFNASGLVIGGNITKSFGLFRTGMQTEFQRFGVAPAIYISRLEENAALAGSARLCDNDFYRKLLNTSTVNQKNSD